MCDNSEFNITTQRFRELIDNEKYAKVPRAEIAKALNCDTSTITKYYNGQRQLSVDSIIKFSKYFNVSSDYLLGLTDSATTDKDIQFICDYTGLDYKAIYYLSLFKREINDKSFNDFVNNCIDMCCDFGSNIIEYFWHLDIFCKTYNYAFDSLDDETLSNAYFHLIVLKSRFLKAFEHLLNCDELISFEKMDIDLDDSISHQINNKRIKTEQNNNIDDDLPF